MTTIPSDKEEFKRFITAYAYNDLLTIGQTLSNNLNTIHNELIELDKCITSKIDAYDRAIEISQFLSQKLKK